MDMIQIRNLTSNTYDEATASKISTAIRDTYSTEFVLLKEKMGSLREEQV